MDSILLSSSAKSGKQIKQIKSKNFYYKDNVFISSFLFFSFFSLKKKRYEGLLEVGWSKSALSETSGIFLRMTKGLA